ncbi:MAG TPA: SpoIIE family protein phosphatase [Pseudonocardia sp.]
MSDAVPPGLLVDDGAHVLRVAALQRLAGELLGATTPAAIGELVVTTAADLLDADAAMSYSRTDEQTLEVLHSTGWPDEVTRPYRRLELHPGRPLSDAVLTGEPVWLESAQQWRARYPDMAPVGTAAQMQASACLPLTVDDRDLGAVVFSFSSPRTFSADERRFLLAVTALCAQGLDRARLLLAERAARAEAERRLGHMTFLSRSSRLMEAPLSVEQRLQQLADLAASEIADWCAVHLVRGNDVAQVAVAHRDPAKVAFVAQLERRYPPDPKASGGAIQVSRTGESAFFPEISDELLAAAAVDEEHLALIRSIGMRSAVVVPLSVRGRRLGAVTLVHAESDRRFDANDLAFAEQLAATAAVALDNARLYENQLRTAHTLQNALLPAALPEVAGLRLAAHYRTQTDEGSDVHVGGDLYDVIAGPAPGQWGFVVADVCGKGAEAAAVTALIRHTVRAEIGHGLGPTAVLQRLNRAMLRETKRTSRFATVAHGQLTLTATGATVRLANAGHPPPLMLHDGQVTPVDAPGTLLGVYQDVEISEVTLELRRGDILVLYTDGVTEARGVDGFYGAQRLAQLVGSVEHPTADEVADRLLADVEGFQRGLLRDDIAILVVEATP